MRKVDGLNIIFIDFYVPAIPRLNTTQPSLQLSEDITVLAICRIYLYRCHLQDLERRQVFGVYHLYIGCTMWWTEQNLVAPLLVYPLAQTFHIRPNL
jgi:hypothetical protein